jgi:hypothetical protein
VDGIVFDVRGNRGHQRAKGEAQAPHHREIRRVGWLRFIDVLAFRAYYAAARARADRQWAARALTRLREAFPVRPDAPEIVVSSPNGAEAERFIRERRPELIVARCKSLLREQIFSIPRLGTFVMHPGICPEYRNAHGCFWAVANGDRDNIGMTLLRIDRGVDTGPVFGYFRVKPQPRPESHVIVEHRVVLDHLDAIRDLLLDIEAGRGRAHRHERPPLGSVGPALAQRAPADEGAFPPPSAG